MLKATKEIAIITQECGKYYFSAHSSGELYGGLTLESVEPIPLTPEVLEKNGWKKDTTHLSLKNVINVYIHSDIKGFGYFPILLAEDYNGTFVVYPFTDGNICKPITYIKYASDLQHLLFGLGLNSKIEI